MWTGKVWVWDKGLYGVSFSQGSFLPCWSSAAAGVAFKYLGIGELLNAPTAFLMLWPQSTGTLTSWLVCLKLDLFFPCVSARVLVLLFYVVNSDVIDFTSVGRQRSDWPSRTQVLVCSEFGGNAKWCRSAHDRHSWEGNYNNTDRKLIIRYISKFTLPEMVLFFPVLPWKNQGQSVSPGWLFPVGKSSIYSDFLAATQGFFQASRLLFWELWKIWIFN